MGLLEKLSELGVLATFDEIGFGAEHVFGGLTKETEAQYLRYEWINLPGLGVHAIPPADLLEAGYPWEEWYTWPPEQPKEHHILFLKKTDLCNDTYDCAADNMDYPASVRGKFWYLYNDEDLRLLYAR